MSDRVRLVAAARALLTAYDAADYYNDRVASELRRVLDEEAESARVWVEWPIAPGYWWQRLEEEGGKMRVVEARDCQGGLMVQTRGGGIFEKGSPLLAKGPFCGPIAAPEADG